MDKALKILKWIWDVKERALLVVLVLALGVQVYRMVAPPDVEDVAPPTVAPPRASLPDDWQDGPPRPNTVDPPQLPRVPVDELTRRSPFTVRDTQPAAPRELTPERAGLQLLRIVPWRGDAHRAELRINQRRQRMDEGDEYQGFRVERIDANAGEVDVYSTEHDRLFTLTVEGGS